MGCSHGPKIASRWSQVQTESQPARSAASAASRKSGHDVCCDQSWSPKRISRSGWRCGEGAKPEADPGLPLELAVDDALGLLGVVGVVAPGHARDVRLGRRLVLDDRHEPGQIPIQR